MNKTIALLTGAVVVASLTTSNSASAMNYSWRAAGNQIVIDASGEIALDEGERLIDWVASQNWSNRKAAAIVFNSRVASLAARPNWQGSSWTSR